MGTLLSKIRPHAERIYQYIFGVDIYDPEQNPYIFRYPRLIAILDKVLTVVYSLGGLFLVLWCIPYNFVVKQHILRLLAKSGVTQFTFLVSPFAMLIFAATVIYSYLRLYKMRKYRYLTRALVPKNRASDPSNEIKSSSSSSSSMTSSETEADVLKLQLTRYNPVPFKWTNLAVKNVRRITKILYKAIASLSFMVFARRATYLLLDSVDDLIALEAGKIEREMLKFRPSPLLLRTVTAPFRAVLSPVFLGLENIPDERPLLFVSNHTLMALDFPVLLEYLWRKKRIYLRALADHSHFQVPINGDFLRNQLGAVDGTRRNVDLLMDAKETVFVYPGGAREVFKKKQDPKYLLKWGDRLGFVAQAIKHGCTIIPVVNYGTEDMVNIIGDFPLSWLPIPFIWNSDRTFPLLAPKELQRIYFYFGKPVRTDTPELKGRHDHEQECMAVRDQTKQAIEDGIEYLRQYAKKDPARSGRVRVTQGVRTLSAWIQGKKPNSFLHKERLRQRINEAHEAASSKRIFIDNDRVSNREESKPIVLPANL